MIDGGPWRAPAARARRADRLAALAAAAAVVIVLAACGGGGEAEAPPAPRPDAGADADTVVGCAPGEAELEGGGCRRPGVPPESCAPGFTADEVGGCAAVMPAEPCPKGMIAVPGDTACREIMPCGEGTWGAIPIEPGTEFVDASFTGPSYGTQLNPFRTIGEAVDAAEDGDVIAVAAGTYTEGVVIWGNPVRIWGVCPSKVTVVSAVTGVDDFSVAVGEDADGAEVHGLAMTGPGAGFVVQGSSSVLLDRVWIHDTGNKGLVVQEVGGVGTTGAHVTGSLIELAGGVGAQVFDATLTMEASVIRDALPDWSTTGGHGFEAIHPEGKSGATVAHIERCVLERNREVGAIVSGQVTAAIEGSLVRDTLPGPSLGARGAYAQSDTSGGRAALEVRASVFEGGGLGAAGADLTVEDTVVRRTGSAAAADTAIGSGNLEGTPIRSTLTIARCLVEDTTGEAVAASGSDLVMTGTVVRRTTVDAAGVGGPGVTATLSIDADVMPFERARATITSSLLEENVVGVLALGADLTFERSESSRNRQKPLEDSFGTGMIVGSVAVSLEEPDAGAADPIYVLATAVIRRSAFHDNFDLGINITAAESTIEDVVITGTKSNAAGDFGDGIGITGHPGVPSAATITRAEVRGNARAGVGNWGASVSIRDAVLTCNAFDLSADPDGVLPAVYVDEGGNVCGCDGATAPCKALSTHLSPPGIL